MRLIYNEEKLNTVLNDFYVVTKINVDFLDSDRKLLCKKGRQTHNPYCRAVRSSKIGRLGCSASDEVLLDACEKSRHVEVHTCHAGLVDAAVPVIYNGMIAGYILIGAMRRTVDFTEIHQKLTDYPLHDEKMARYYEQLPVYDEKTIASIANIAAMLASYVIGESMLQLSDSMSFGSVVDYIEANLPVLHSFQDIVDRTHVSKSTLFREFRKNYDCTPGEYLIRRKIEHAKRYLADEELSIEAVSQKLGFSTHSYFGRTFRKLTGISPSDYRRRHKK